MELSIYLNSKWKLRSNIFYKYLSVQNGVFFQCVFTIDSQSNDQQKFYFAVNCIKCINDYFDKNFELKIIIFCVSLNIPINLFSTNVA